MLYMYVRICLMSIFLTTSALATTINTSTNYKNLIAILEGIYEKHPNPADFDKELAKFETEVNAASKNDEAKHAIEVIMGIKSDSSVTEGKLAKIFEKFLSSETLNQKELQILNEVSDLGNRLEKKKSLSQAMSLNEFNKIQSSGVSTELLSLGEKGFKQDVSSGACVLYSFLFGVLHTDVLRDQILGLIRKDSAGNYFVKDLFKNKIYKITAEAIKGAHNEMNPSNAPVLRAIGLYAYAKFHEFFPRVDLTQYVIFHDGKDIFFNSPVFDFNKDDLLKADFSKTDGSITLGGKKYTGHFVISIGTTRFSGHAICVFFDAQSKKWKIYDNIYGKTADVKELKEYKIISAVAIGKVEH